MSETVNEEMGNTPLLTNSSSHPPTHSQTHPPNTPIIQIKHLSKRYQIGMDRTYKTFCETAVDTIKSPLKRLKSFSRQEETFWALKDINFEVYPGEVVGIIGRNGAGKTTLLKVLSRITHPTEGEIILRGRVASLLEVGTGFHPELTGRENVYFNGAILGMTKQEIEDKFDEIVEFSGVADFLDTPLKRYSSGMQVRLAFAVAAHLEPEILVVDEVLAVGDVEFQKKCLGKMKEVAGGGRTVLFVSHNMNAVNDLCERTILLHDGKIDCIGDTKSIISKYLSLAQTHSSQPYKEYLIKPVLPAQILSIRLKNEEAKECNNFFTNEKAITELSFEMREPIRGYSVGICLFKQITPIWLSEDTDFDLSLLEKRNKGVYRKQIEIPINVLKPGNYQICPSIGRLGRMAIDSHFDDGLEFTITLAEKELLYTSLHPEVLGFLRVPKKWKNRQ